MLYALIVAVYLYASLPFGLVATRILCGKRLDQEGTGRISVVAAFRVGGFWPGVIAIAGEASKGILAVVLGRILFEGDLLSTLLLVAAAFAGSAFPLFHRFQGSHGSTVAMWSLLLLSPLSLAILFLLSVAANLLFHNRLNLKRLWILAIVPTVYLVERSWLFAGLGALMATVFWFKGRQGLDDNRYYFGRTASGSFVALLGHDTISPQSGAKARNLLRLVRMHRAVPITWVIEPAALDAFRIGPHAALDKLRAELEDKLDLDKVYAVRSSASVEDSANASYAGQFVTELGIEGLDNILLAVEAVWQSADSASAQVYHEHQQADSSTAPIQMSVLVQEMVDAKLAGVAFSRDPNTGRDQIVVEAIEGTGEALVQGLETPGRWVWKWGTWTERPDESPHESIIAQVVQETAALASQTGRALDLEWAWDGQQLYWLQMRDITTHLAAVDVFSNRISGEFLPGIIKPLVFSVNVPLVNTAWIRLLERLVGPLRIHPEELAESFYYRAYFNMGVLGRIFEAIGLPYDLLETLMGIEGGSERPGFRPTPATLRHIPRMAWFSLSQLLRPSRYQARIEQLQDTFDCFADMDLEKLDDGELLATLDSLYQTASQAVLLNVLLPMLNSGYTQWLKSDLERMEKTLDDIDLVQPYADAFARIDPQTSMQELASLWHELPASDRDVLTTRGARALDEIENKAFPRALQAFLATHGHHSESGNDFSVAPWREQPELILQMIASPLAERGSDRASIEQLAGLDGARLWFKWVARRASLHALLREEISSVYTRGYGLFRPFYLEIGSRLTARHQLDQADDIFYLDATAVRSALLDKNRSSLQYQAAHVKHEIDTWRDANLPDIIYGRTPPEVLSGAETGAVLEGTPTSRGYYTGRATVTRSLSDMHLFHDGDVLIVPYSDIGWTPLFARAGAIVSERGGMLSHSSIVAREYGIPAVVAVPHATSIPSGTRLLIDGYRGTVTIADQVE